MLWIFYRMHQKSNRFITKYSLVLFNVDIGCWIIKSDRLDEADWVTFVFFGCCNFINWLLLFRGILVSVVIGKTNIGTDNDIGEGLDGDSLFLGKDITGLFIGLFWVLITGDEHDFSSWFGNGGRNILGVIIVVVPHKCEAEVLVLNVEYGFKEASV